MERNDRPLRCWQDIEVMEIAFHPPKTRLTCSLISIKARLSQGRAAIRLVPSSSHFAYLTLLPTRPTHWAPSQTTSRATEARSLPVRRCGGSPGTDGGGYGSLIKTLARFATTTVAASMRFLASATIFFLTLSPYHSIE